MKTIWALLLCITLPFAWHDASAQTTGTTTTTVTTSTSTTQSTGGGAQP